MKRLADEEHFLLGGDKTRDKYVSLKVDLTPNDEMMMLYFNFQCENMSDLQRYGILRSQKFPDYINEL